jgi:predicted PolB exonuclease-like 3'-5' exonuclease
MSEFVIAWDLETVPDLACVARVHRLNEPEDDVCREALGEKFPKHVFHKIACIGALVAERTPSRWEVRSLGAPHMGQRSEAELIQAFVDRVDELRPCLVTFNGSSFDMPVLRYRAMMNSISAPGFERRPYFHRYSDHHIDLCDALACYSSQGKLALDAICCALGLPGKPEGMSGSEVDRYVREGRIGDISAYCEIDVVATYRVWLRYELFRGRLTKNEFEASESSLLEFISERVSVKPHLQHTLQQSIPSRSTMVSNTPDANDGLGFPLPADEAFQEIGTGLRAAEL